MAELTPLFMDISNVYSGDDLGLPYRDLVGEGIVGANDLAVTQRAAGADLSVDVAPGAAWVTGDTNPDAQPTYRVRNDATANLGISPDPSNPRKVIIVAQITDETFSGVGRTWTLDAIHGTPAASPAEPALPDSALKLATITVPAAAASIVTADIADKRVRAKIGGGTVLGPGAEIAYVELSADRTITGTSDAGSTIMMDTGTIEYDGTPIIIEGQGVGFSGTGFAIGDALGIDIFDGGSEVGQVWYQAMGQNAHSEYINWHFRRRLVPAPGNHDYRLNMFHTGSGSTWECLSRAGGANFLPTYMRITKV